MKELGLWMLNFDCPEKDCNWPLSSPQIQRVYECTKNESSIVCFRFSQNDAKPNRGFLQTWVISQVINYSHTPL